jgi:hypothetical protein
MARKAAEQNAPMRNITAAWLAKIDLALKVRDEQFGQYAEEALQFFDGETNYMWAEQRARGNSGFLDREGGSLPTFRIQVNKLFEAVAYFGPALYAQNPNGQVTPILPPEVPPEALGIDPNDPYGMQEYMAIAQQEALKMASKRACASVKQNYLNWLQRETDKKTEARRGIGEGIVAGIGFLETVMHQPPSGKIVMPRSRYLSWSDVVFDPDASYFEDVQWMAIRRCGPVNKVEERFGYERGELKGQYQSYASQPTPKAKKEAKQYRGGKSFDQIEYWEVFSKNGFGDLLFDDAKIPKVHQLDYSVFGPYCYIVCAQNIPQPLNIPQSVLTAAVEAQDDTELMQRVQWPIPYWYDDGGWPVSRLCFYDKPNCIWPIPMFKPAMGELKFVNWCLSFLADKVAASCGTYIGVLKEAGTEIQRQIASKNGPFTIIEIATALGKPLDQMVSFLQAPNFSIDIWKMIAEVMVLIDKRTGLTELMYGLQATQDRSATATNIKQGNNSIRPDDMASRVEDWLSEVQIREMQAARWFCEAKDIEPVCGTLGALVWQNYVMPSDVDDTVLAYDYRIEAGSARKPNKANKAEQLISLGQYMLPVMQEMALAGMVDPWNAYVADIAESMDIDPTGYLLPQPPPKEEGPSPEQQELELKFAELQMKLQAMQQEMQLEAVKADQEIEHDEIRMEMEADAHEQEMAQGKQEIALEKQKTTAQVQSARAKAKAKPKAGTKR